jgi:cation diffusion facilitator family transporter
MMTSTLPSHLRRRAASLALVGTIGLTAFKLVVAYFSGSVSVLSEGIHSFLDLVGALITYFTVQEAGKPADEEHPFGHGKIETLSSLFEALLLVLAAIVVTYEGIDHFFHPHEVVYQGVAIATISLSVVVSYFIYRQNRGIARQTESIALEVNALHFLSDVVASLGVLAGLIILNLTGWLVVDAIVAFGVAAYILYIASTQVKKAILELSDTHLPADEIAKIQEVLLEFRGRQMIEAHNLRTRKGGSTRHIDFHMVVCGKLSVDESHAVCDRIEARIHEVFSDASVNIHVEPCAHARIECEKYCPVEVKK